MDTLTPTEITRSFLCDDFFCDDPGCTGVHLTLEELDARWKAEREEESFEFYLLYTHRYGPSDRLRLEEEAQEEAEAAFDRAHRAHVNYCNLTGQPLRW